MADSETTTMTGADALVSTLADHGDFFAHRIPPTASREQRCSGMLAHHPFRKITPFRKLDQPVGSLNHLFLHTRHITRDNDHPLTFFKVRITTVDYNTSALVHRCSRNKWIVFFRKFGVILKVDVTSTNRK